MLTKALRNASLSFFGTNAPPCFFPFTPAGPGEEVEARPLAASHVLLRRCFGFLGGPGPMKNGHNWFWEVYSLLKE